MEVDEGKMEEDLAVETATETHGPDRRHRPPSTPLPRRRVAKMAPAAVL